MSNSLYVSFGKKVTDHPVPMNIVALIGPR
jgi:hypothetical protein